MKASHLVSGVRTPTGKPDWVIQTPRIAIPGVSPRFVPASQPQKADDSLEVWSPDKGLEENSLAGGKGFIEQDNCGESYSVTPTFDPSSEKSQQNQTLDILINWLNAEVRDRLDSIDRKLEELHGTRAPERRSLIRESISHTSHDLESEQVIRRPFASLHTSESQIYTKSEGPTAASMCVSSLDRKRTVDEMIQKHRETHGTHVAAAWRFFEDRSSSLAAFVWSLVIPGLVFISLVVSFWQTVDSCPLPRTAGEILHALCEVVFAVELLIRFLVCPDRRVFIRSPLNTIDLLTCLPLGVRLVAAIAGLAGDHLDAENLLSALTLLPVLRLLKLTRRFEKFQLLLSAFLIAVEALPVLLYTMLAMALVFSSLIYAVEPRENIYNLPHAMWFVLVTMTTCGYGDVAPSTLPGKLIASALMICSILYMAMPIGIVGNAFGTAWDARDRLLLMQRIREAFLHQGFNATAFKEIVTTFLGDCDNELGFEEFQSVLQSMNININADRVYLLLDSLDKDGNGKVNVDELLSGLFPHDYAAYFNTLSKSACWSLPMTSFNSTGSSSFRLA